MSTSARGPASRGSSNNYDMDEPRGGSEAEPEVPF